MLSKLLSDYCDSHQRLWTKISHLIGVPFIVFALSIVFNWLELTIYGVGCAPVTWILVTFLMIFYCFFDWHLALISAAWLLGLSILSFFIFGIVPSLRGFYTFGFCFILGWFFLLLGHVFEKKRPAFVNNAWQVFTAPLFITLQVAVWLGFKKDLMP
jgi:uncharacterized membrane protein YGL010W